MRAQSPRASSGPILTHQQSPCRPPGSRFHWCVARARHLDPGSWAKLLLLMLLVLLFCRLSLLLSPPHLLTYSHSQLSQFHLHHLHLLRRLDLRHNSPPPSKQNYFHYPCVYIADILHHRRPSERKHEGPRNVTSLQQFSALDSATAFRAHLRMDS